MKHTLIPLVCLLALPALGRADTVADDVKAIREELRVRNASGPYIAKHADKRLKEWRAAAEACFSWTNADAVRRLEKLQACRSA